MTHTPHTSHRSHSIDLGLAVLAVIRPPHTTFSCRAIAAACDCSWQNIHQIERKALRHLRDRLRRDWQLTYDQLIETKNFE
jgi:hypothetical protein